MKWRWARGSNMEVSVKRIVMFACLCLVGCRSTRVTTTAFVERWLPDGRAVLAVEATFR